MYNNAIYELIYEFKKSSLGKSKSYMIATVHTQHNQGLCSKTLN